MKFFCRFKVDEVIQEHGHKVLCLPPYLYNLNPTKLVWSQSILIWNVSCDKYVGGIIAENLFSFFMDYKVKTSNAI
jgi:hypothetical protein